MPHRLNSGGTGQPMYAEFHSAHKTACTRLIQTGGHCQKPVDVEYRIGRTKIKEPQLSYLL